MNIKILFRELLTLIIIVAMAWLPLFGFTIHPGNIDIPLHDTYMVFSGMSVFIPLTFLLVTLVYFIKAIIPRFNSRLGFIILLSANMLFVLKLLKFYTLANMFPKGHWTLYPPVASEPGIAVPLSDSYTMFNYPAKILFAVTIFFIVLLVIGAIITGKNWKTKAHVPETI